MRMSRFEWRSIFSRFVPAAAPKPKSSPSGREPTVYETRIDGKRLQVSGLTKGEARAELKRMTGLATTAGVMLVEKRTTAKA